MGLFFRGWFSAFGRYCGRPRRRRKKNLSLTCLTLLSLMTMPRAVHAEARGLLIERGGYIHMSRFEEVVRANVRELGSLLRARKCHVLLADARRRFGLYPTSLFLPTFPSAPCIRLASDADPVILGLPVLIPPGLESIPTGFASTCRPGPFI